MKSKVKLGLLLFYSFFNIYCSSQVIKVANVDNYTIEKLKDSHEYFLRISDANNVSTTFRIRLETKPKIVYKSYNYQVFKNLPREKDKVFTPYTAFSFGGGYFLIENIFYKNLGSPIP